jgi:hypothetical protein
LDGSLNLTLPSIDTASNTPLSSNFVAYMIILPLGAMLGDSSRRVEVNVITLRVSKFIIEI